MSKDLPTNPVAARSRLALLDAATGLLDARPAAEISIKDVVSAAGMSRPTFYQHFTDVGDAFAAAGMSRFESAVAGMPDAGHSDGVPGTVPALFGALLSRLSEHSLFYARVGESPGGAPFHAEAVRATSEWLHREPQLTGTVTEDGATREFLAAGVVWTVMRYLTESCRDTSVPSPEGTLARLLLSFEPVQSSE
ncbi:MULTISPECIES: TetR/AcrR family transcriptional regulator [Arthrobacter]|uniref:TetR/AcrR family transcriptional regulator n=2 Tax=Arthrobacter TaxID=1663 RepID=A0ABU9KHM7_9MICC|nr:TetR/AcrR family transcriptional regulator [Arthrobacter sp. YJM1]MDP5226271.1 TetR/AcrR family transcriptional regulator [Arthrobacter sp. YJM1]